VDGRIFIAAKYYPGGSLRQKLAAQGKLPYLQALHILQQVSAGLQAGHEAGLIHRDVKPENILFD